MEAVYGASALVARGRGSEPERDDDDDGVVLAKRAFTRAPCPNAQGRTIGTIEPFTVLCGVDLAGDDMRGAVANNITECADLCAKAQPRCYAVAFMPDPAAQNRTENCYLKGGDIPTPTTQTFIMDAAIAAGPTATADCSSAGATYTAKAGPTVRFSVFCGKDYPRDDIGKVYAATMGSCMDQCAQRNNCRGVSYDGFQGQGFQNCFLKSTSNPSGLMEQSFSIDSALVATSSAASAPDTSSTSPPPPPPPATTSTTATAAPSTNSAPLTWVAGPVVGGAAAVLIIGVALRFFAVRRKKRHAPTIASSELDTTGTMVSPVPTYVSPTYVSPYGNVKHELPSNMYREASELA